MPRRVGLGPVYYYVDSRGTPKLTIGENVFSLDDAFIYAAREGNLGLTELCKELVLVMVMMLLILIMY